MAFDIVIAVLLAGAFGVGYSRGLVRALLGTIAAVVALVAAVKLSGWCAWWLHSEWGWDGTWLPIAGLLLVFIAVMLVFHVVAQLIEGLLKAVALGFVNRAAGGLLFALVAALLLSTGTWYADAAGWLPESATSESRTYSALLEAAPAVTNVVGEAVPVVKDAYSDLERFFEDLAANGPVTGQSNPEKPAPPSGSAAPLREL